MSAGTSLSVNNALVENSNASHALLFKSMATRWRHTKKSLNYTTLHQKVDDDPEHTLYNA